MSRLRDMFGPKNAGEELVFAVEGLLIDVQLAIEIAMHEKGVSKRELADRLGCTPSNVTQLLSENAKLKVETVAKIFHALEMACEFRCRPRKHEAKHERPQEVSWLSVTRDQSARRFDVVRVPDQPVQAQNSNRFEQAKAA